jgi:PIN domain nuclease of toxin-antitoxin system
LSDVLADTHAVVWLLFDSKQLSAPALKSLRDAEVAGGRILISAITFVELVYLTEKGKLPGSILPTLFPWYLTP